ncbi:hypothetical protein [uncultured Sphingomonas sp.]|uniref:hypothetical protein n=1 Tax=uncultured Sphingomonas sp. TaxID=158754 RepID=UPI0035CC2F44
MILKTYTRIFTNDAEATLRILRPLHASEPHLRFRFDPWQLIGIGDVLIVGGTDDALAPIRGSLGPWIVTDIDETRALLVDAGAEITQDIAAVPTGRMMYARHRDGAVVEYVQWTPELVEQLIAAPQRAGKLASQL